MFSSHYLRTISAPAVVNLWLYVRRELLYLSWALMEVAVLTPIFLAMMPWTRFWSPGLFALVLLLLMLIPFNMSRAMTLRRWPLARQQNWLAAGLVVALFFVYRLLLYGHYSLFSLAWLGEMYDHLASAGNPFWGRDLLIFFVVVIVWWRGISLVGRPIGIRSLGLRVRVVGLLLLPLVIGVTGSSLPWSLAPYALLFFFAAMMAVALVRAEEIELDRSGHSFPLSARWVGAIALVSLAIVLAAGLLAALASGRSIVSLVGWLAPLWLGINFAATAAAASFAYSALPVLRLADTLFLALRNLLNSVYQPAATPPAAAGAAQPPLDYYRLLQEAATSINSQMGGRISIIIFIIIILALILLSLERFYRRRRGFHTLGEGEAARPDGREDVGGAGLGDRLRDRFDRLRRWRAALTVRRIYQSMARAAAANGYGRRPTQTPFEYLATLDRAWPNLGSDARLITDAYVRVRYGEVPETSEEMAAIRAAWRRLERSPPVDNS